MRWVLQIAVVSSIFIGGTALAPDDEGARINPYSAPAPSENTLEDLPGWDLFLKESVNTHLPESRRDELSNPTLDRAFWNTPPRVVLALSPQQIRILFHHLPSETTRLYRHRYFDAKYPEWNKYIRAELKQASGGLGYFFVSPPIRYTLGRHTRTALPELSLNLGLLGITPSVLSFGAVLSDVVAREYGIDVVRVFNLPELTRSAVYGGAVASSAITAMALVANAFVSRDSGYGDLKVRDALATMGELFLDKKWRHAWVITDDDLNLTRGALEYDRSDIACQKILTALGNLYGSGGVGSGGK